jgi:hypothetical protein
MIIFRNIRQSRMRANYKYLIEHSILPSIPSWESGSSLKANRFNLKRFLYDETTDTYKCPQGNTLHRHSDTVYNNSYTYHARKKECSKCSLRENCISPKISCKHIFRQINQTFKDKAMEIEAN